MGHQVLVGQISTSSSCPRHLSPGLWGASRLLPCVDLLPSPGYLNSVEFEICHWKPCVTLLLTVGSRRPLAWCLERSKTACHLSSRFSLSWTRCLTVLRALGRFTEALLPLEKNWFYRETTKVNRVFPKNVKYGGLGLWSQILGGRGRSVMN